MLVVGSGGLGCPALQVLVSSGIGKIGIVDFDVVEIQNLHRQFLFDEKDIGFPKVIVAEKHLKNRNSETEIEIFNEKITTKNVIHLIYHKKTYERGYKDYEFSAATMQEHWQSGLDDIENTFRHPDWFGLPDTDEIFVTHDIHQKRKKLSQK